MGPSTTYLVYRTGTTLVANAVQNGVPGWFRVWTAQGGGNPSRPAGAVATVSNGAGAPSYKAMISYWAVNSSNALTMRFTWIGKPNTDKGSQIPCVFDGYWGEYDEMVVQNDGTAT